MITASFKKNVKPLFCFINKTQKKSLKTGFKDHSNLIMNDSVEEIHRLDERWVLILLSRSLFVKYTTS